ncbi:hypothetical protein PYCCODRAFT_1429319 [Trametes coccinea BRFM310]|uniref:RING-type domain-containing protein n=1 Tax=Trametes coccinea (strain BRFM310) TaxID=1353009 RepID=A0A1Y2J5R9_TRAC3|nr:hypothetical protein PYCCODRAFT_1429319 [Trametes coccinea BRFM310]
MDEAAQIVHESTDSFYNASMFFNASLKLAHRFFSLPSRALARLRRLDDLALDLHEAAQHHPYASTSASGSRRSRGQISSGPPVPGMWGFLTSGYFLGLFIMAFVLNRIQNIVVPPRRPPGFRIHHNSFNMHARLSWRRLFLSWLLPVDLSSTHSRLLFRIPSMYLLGKAVALWTVLLVQAAGPTSLLQAGWMQPLFAWIAEKKMDDICWYTFLSACATLCIGALTTGLEGLNMNDSSPFNLFAFAFQLYVCAASHTFLPKEGEPPSRPDVHVIITIMLPLIQLVVMHCLEVKQRWTQYRLILSSTIGLLALIHFHSVVWFSPHAYPLTTYAARVVESIMLAVISFTVGLNAMTQLLLDGSITRPLVGHSAILPRWDEDFNVALFRLGTASMDATAVAGFGNEVGGVASARPAFSALALRNARNKAELVRGELELDRTGVAGLSPAYEERGGVRRVVRKGFANEITSVKAKAASTDLWMNTVLNIAWQRHFGAFLASAWRAAVRVLRASIRCLSRKSRVKKNQERSSTPTPQGNVSGGANSESGLRQPTSEDPYSRFLRGEDVSDDEDEFHPDDYADGPDNMPTPSSVSEGEDEDEDEAAVPDVAEFTEQAQLYADLSTSAAQAASAPLLLAHMTDTSPSPLTRRGYRRLVSGSRRAADADDWEEWDEFVLERRRVKRAEAEAKGEDAFAEQTRNCVICTVEARDIICWPCRCLALCDDCRENLASRSSASKHTCPCCRRSVEGYSKIYIP